MNTSHVQFDYFFIPKEEYPVYSSSRGNESSSSGSSLNSSSGCSSGSEVISYEDHCGPGLESLLIKTLKANIPNLSHELLLRISSDILRLSGSEPYGIRGATLTFQILERQSSKPREIIRALRLDNSILSTFRLVFCLREEASGLRMILRRILSGMRRLRRTLCGWSDDREETIPLSNDYSVNKQQFYR